MSTDTWLMSTDNCLMSTDNRLMSTDNWPMSTDNCLMWGVGLTEGRLYGDRCTSVFHRDPSAMPDPTRPSVLRRLDGLAVAGIALLLYRELGVSWWIFLVAFLAPDLAFLGFLGGKRAGTAAYNALHTYLWPAVLFAIGLVGERTWLMAAGLIWLAHLGLDRMLGFGLRETETSAV